MRFVLLVALGAALASATGNVPSVPAVRARLRALWRSPVDLESSARAREDLLRLATSGDSAVSGAALTALAEAAETTGNPLGVPANSSLAVALYEAAAVRGNPSAQFALASLHLEGLFGLARDPARAVSLLYFAAAGGSADAQAALGRMHAEGKVVPKSCRSAAAFLLPAGVRTAAGWWPNMPVVGPEYFRLDADKLAAPSERLDTLKERVQFTKHAAQKGDKQARASLGRVYYSGHMGEARDVLRAMEEWEAAALDGAAPAIAALGHMHAEGVPSAALALEDDDVRLLREADAIAAQQHPNNNNDEDEDEDAIVFATEEEAEKLLEAAVEHGNSAAATSLALLLLRRHGFLPRPNVTALLRLTDRPSWHHPASTLSSRALTLPHAAQDPALHTLTASDSEQDPAVRRTALSVARDPPKPSPPPGALVPGGSKAAVAAAAAATDVRRALELLVTGIRSEVPEALFAAALLRLRGVPDADAGGKGLEANFAKAHAHLQAAARRGMLPALLALARMDAAGIGVEASCAQAVAHLTALVRLGRAQDDLAVAQRRLEHGDAVGAAFAWTRAAAMRMRVASWNLGFVADRLAAEERSIVGPMSSGQRGDAVAGTLTEESALEALANAADAAFRAASRRLFVQGPQGSTLLAATGAQHEQKPSREPAAKRSGAAAPGSEKSATEEVSKSSGEGAGGGSIWQRIVHRSASNAPPSQMEAATTDAEDEAAVVAVAAADKEHPSPNLAVSEQEDGLWPLLTEVLEGESAHAGLLTAGQLLPRSARSPAALASALDQLALRLYRAAAEGGTDTGALLMVGEFLRQGRGQPDGTARPGAAEPHLRRAAARRDPRALWTLAQMHEQGEGLPQDWHLAKRLYDEAEGAGVEASGPAWFGRTRLWFKARLAPLLPQAVAAVLEPLLGPMQSAHERAMDEEQIQVIDDDDDDEEEAAIGTVDDDAAVEEEMEEEDEEADATEAALSLIKRRRRRAAQRRAAAAAAAWSLRTGEVLRWLGLPASWCKAADDFSQGDPELALMALLGIALVVVVVLIPCSARGNA